MKYFPLHCGHQNNELSGELNMRNMLLHPLRLGKELMHCDKYTYS